MQELVFTRREELEFGIEVLNNWVDDNLFEVPDDEIHATLKDIEKLQKELKELKESEDTQYGKA